MEFVDRGLYGYGVFGEKEKEAAEELALRIDFVERLPHAMHQDIISGICSSIDDVEKEFNVTVKSGTLGSGDIFRAFS